MSGQVRCAKKYRECFLKLWRHSTAQLLSVLPMLVVPHMTQPFMTLLLLVGLDWLSLRTVLLLSQMSRHSGEAQLGRAFQQELRDRGLIDAPPDR